MLGSPEAMPNSPFSIISRVRLYRFGLLFPIQVLRFVPAHEINPDMMEHMIGPPRELLMLFIRELMTTSSAPVTHFPAQAAQHNDPSLAGNKPRSPCSVSVRLSVH